MKTTRLRLAALLDQMIAILLADTVNPVAGQAIGAALADLLDDDPTALGRTQELLGRDLLGGLSASTSIVLQPQLAALLGALGTGFVQRALERARATVPLGLTSTAQAAAPNTDCDYGLLIEHIPAITYIAAFDMASSTIYTSTQIEAILGFTQAEWMDDNTLWLTQIHPADRAGVVAELDRIHAGGMPKPCEYRMRTRDGRVVWFRDEMAIMRDVAGQPIAIYGVMLNITDRKQVEAQLTDVRRRLAEVRDAERLRIAHDLHDDAVQQLLGVGLLIEDSQRQLAACNDLESLAVVQAVALEHMRSAIQTAAAHIRGVISELRPVGLEGLGLSAALAAYVAQVQHAQGRSCPLIVLDLDPHPPLLPRASALCLYRAAQEGLRNALRHAHAQRIQLSVRQCDDALTLAITDDGCGMAGPLDGAALLAAGHFGLAGMAERVAEIDGQLTIESQPNHGTTLIVRIPFLIDGAHQ